MFALSFRTKLLLAMMLVVAGVTATTLYVTQQRVQQSYEKLFEERFRTQVKRSIERQQVRLEPLIVALEKACQAPRVVAAMEEPDNTDDIYENVGLLLNESIRARNSPVNLQRAAVGNRRTGAKLIIPSVLVLDAEGKLLLPKNLQGLKGLNQPGGAGVRMPRVRQIQRSLTEAGRHVARLRETSTGYLAPEEENGTNLSEIVLAPVIDPADTNKVLGALTLSAPLPDDDQDDIPSGVFLEGRLFSTAISGSLAAAISKRLATEVGTSARRGGDFELTSDGTGYRAFYDVLNPGSPFPAAYQVSLYSLAGVNVEKRELRVKILTASCVLMVGALAVCLVIAHGLSVPLKELVAGTTEIERGNYSVKVPVRSGDELGRLGASFNRMAEGLDQKEKFRMLLHQVADKKVAEKMISGEIVLGGELREISVIFCDIRGFTAHTQGMPPQEVIGMLNEHMNVLTRVVSENHGMTDKFVGDLIMAVFGAPISTGQDTLQAARAALQMIEARRRLNETSKHQIEVGIGLATGEAVAGGMGSADRLNYTVLGERVNLGSRLCSAAGRGEVVIDAATLEKLGDRAVVEALPPLKLKGFSELVQAYKLKALKV